MGLIVLLFINSNAISKLKRIQNLQNHLNEWEVEFLAATNFLSHFWFNS